MHRQLLERGPFRSPACVAVKIRCRSRRTSSSTAMPIHGIPVEDLALRSVHLDGVQLAHRFRHLQSAAPHRLTRPTSAPFRAGQHARIRPVMRHHPAEEPNHAVAGFPSPFGVSALASWVILRPLGSCAFLTVGLPAVDLAGPQRGCHVAHEQDPTGQGALFTPGTVVRSRPAAILRPAPAALLRPVPIPRWNIPSAGVTFTRRHRGFTHVRPSPQGGWLPPRAGKRHRFPPVFSSPAAPEWNEGRFGFYPGLRTPRSPTSTPRRRQAIAH